MRMAIRNITGSALVPLMVRTGFRFDKHYRWGTTFGHRMVYAWVDTVGANLKAGINITLEGE